MDFPALPPLSATSTSSFRPKKTHLTLAAALAWIVPGTSLLSTHAATPPSASIDFAREIQPILATHCYDCHGATKPKGGLQLTSLAAARKGGESGDAAIVPGQSAKSTLLQRITTDDENDVMPQKGDRLKPAQIEILRRWIDQGAVWPENVKHWAYVKPVRPVAPSRHAFADSARNPIDHFVFARLEREGLQPSPETDKARWLRRVSLDLIGLPPSPSELAAFISDRNDTAYERVVDRLLASPQYGERWARPWLDLARYADSHGFQRDDLRESWPYRDWVIRAMNADLPFDQFTRWQVGGDLLPAAERAKLPPQDQLDPVIATGFNRGAPTNVEAGTDQEEGRVNQVFDRVNTTGAVWLGTTLECAQCHDHKYDPISQKEYYQLFAYFNNTAQETDFASARAMATLKFTGPFVALPDAAKDEKRRATQAKLDQLDAESSQLREQLMAEFERWQKAARTSLASAGETHPLDIAEFESSGESNFRILRDQSVLLVDDAPDRDTYTITVHTKLTGITAFKLEALTDPSLPGTGPGRGDAERPNFVLNGFQVTAKSASGESVPVKLVKATASFSQARFSVENLLRPEIDNRSGWAINPQFRQDHWASFQTETPIGDPAGLTLTFTLTQNFGAGRTIGKLRLSASTGDGKGDQWPAEIAAILRAPAPSRTKAQVTRLHEFYLTRHPRLESLKKERAKITRELNTLKGPQTLVMQELAEPRMSHVMNRGNFLDRGESVQPGTPAILHATPATTTAHESSSRKPTRLDLAQWLTDRDNPLTARVTVNRWWAEFFGRGIVATVEDFGIKGEPPTHPDLLDWLAVELMERGWSMKHIHKLIVLSATYRQSSRLTPELLARDDQNKLYARGPRLRLDAETIRDNALAVAGLLSLKQGGPPVRPYQSPGLWESKVGGDRVTYDVSEGEDAWRRGIYTVWKRSSPYPSFVNFDATARTACTVRRSRSNTPLQALTLLNDPVYVDAARGFAKRVLTDSADASAAARLRHAFQLCLTREPTAREIAALDALLQQQLNRYNADPAAAKAIAGRFAAPAGVSAAEFAAWHAITTALLNLDETITKG
jgi:mono/diheme cytochrome c family protein